MSLSISLPLIWLMVPNIDRFSLPASLSLSIQEFCWKSSPCFWCDPGQLVEESVSVFRHWSRWRCWSRHHSQVCRGERLRHTSGKSLNLLFGDKKNSSDFFSASGWSQHDCVGQRCDRQRRPSLRHRSPAHSRDRSDPETIAGPLRWSVQGLHLPDDAADSRTVMSGGSCTAARPSVPTPSSSKSPWRLETDVVHPKRTWRCFHICKHSKMLRLFDRKIMDLKCAAFSLWVIYEVLLLTPQWTVWWADLQANEAS